MTSPSLLPAQRRCHRCANGVVAAVVCAAPLLSPLAGRGSRRRAHSATVVAARKASPSSPPAQLRRRC
eukprot:88374-Pleurochrysis_carterae.AAC.1